MPPPTAMTTSARESPAWAKNRVDRLDGGERLGVLAVGDAEDPEGTPGSTPSTQPASSIASWVTITADFAPGGRNRATSWRAPAPTSTG